MRAVFVARRGTVKAKTQAVNQLAALLVSAPREMRDRRLKAKTTACVEGCAHVRPFGQNADAASAYEHTAVVREALVGIGSGA